MQSSTALSHSSVMSTSTGTAASSSSSLSTVAVETALDNSATFPNTTSTSIPPPSSPQSPKPQAYIPTSTSTSQLKTFTSSRLSRSFSLTSPKHSQSLPPPPSSPPRHASRQHPRQLSVEHTTATHSAVHRELQQHFPLHHYHQQYNRHHQRQHSHPQLSPGPTATTLAQSPLRRLTNSAPLSSHRSSLSFSSISLSTSSLTTSASSPRHHIDTNGNNTAATLPPLPSFPPLPLHLDLEELSPITSDQEQQQHLCQGSSKSTNTNTNVNISANTNINIRQDMPDMPVAYTGDSLEPQLIFPSMTGALAHSGANVGMHSLPISGRHGHAYTNNDSNSKSDSDSRNFNGNNNNSSNSSGIAHRKDDNSHITQDNTIGSHFNNNNGRRSESGNMSSRRSSKDSCELNSATSVEDLIDQLIVPDLLNPQDQDARTKVFLMIYRRFMRPRELLEMFIARFDALGEFIEDEPSEANLIRVRICRCLYMWLRDHPNDILHRQTRRRVAAFLRERVAHFPCLNEMYMKILPLSFTGYFDSWRWRQLDHNTLNSHTSSRNSSFSGFAGVTSGNGAHISAAVSIVSDEDSDSGYHDYGSVQGEEDMDEDREWGMRDEEDALQGCSSTASSSRVNSANLDSIAEFAQLVTLSGGRYPQKSLMPSQSPARDRRSSTGSFGQSPACAMDTFVAGRRGSASSVSSNPGPFTAASPQQQPGVEQNTPTNSFAEGEMPPTVLQSIGSIPYIGKRSSSQAYRQQRSPASTTVPSSTTVRHSAPIYIPGSSSGPAAPSIISLASSEPSTSGPIAAAVTKAAMILRDSFDEKIHPFSLHHGKSTSHTQDHPLSPMGGVSGEPAVLNYLTFMEVKDVIIAEQLTCIEYNLFKKLKPRDMLRQVWKTKKGSAAFQACIAHFNYVSSWVGTMILLPPKAKHRAKMIEKFISIAKILRDLGNYNTTMAIIGAMNTSSIHRLVQTRELVQGKEIWNTFKELEHLMGSERSFSEYRAALRASRLPCIPYLGVHLGDLLSISEGNKDFRLDGSTLHWQKFVLMADVITMVMSFQQEPHYRIQPDPYVTRMITDLPVLDDEALYLKSVTIEPSKLNHSRSLSKFAFF